MARYINVDSALQAHPEFLNEQIDDHDKAVYAKGWNACNSAFYGAIKELPTISPDELRGVGKWIDKPYFTECSVCHAEFDSEVTCSEIYGWPWVHCPKCGARLLGDENDS